MALNLKAALILCGAAIGAVGTWRIWRKRRDEDAPPTPLIELMVNIGDTVRVTTILGEHWTGTLEKVYTRAPDEFGVRLRCAECREGPSDALTQERSNVWLAWNCIGSVAVRD